MTRREYNVFEQPPESPFEFKREQIIEDLVENNIFKVGGRQLYELSLYELLKTHTEDQTAE
ncbi:Fur-regulated basic protein FbpA [Planococcus lenghuensis]|uniref:Fur-regulated basic protein FbpA n=1 Tax=Planococcus lenghuensis TaxID=2213202 RepID=A0A1Q2KWH0_9BACL|nr:Fur-regulated basic protein FbpA [Planococcus lenghuensis]AQQ52464.1 hypothetical protein B0X71_04630 [Planococcus lenghuensis]